MNSKSTLQNPIPNRNQVLDPLARVLSTPTEGQIKTISDNEELKKKIQTTQKKKVCFFFLKKIKILIFALLSIINESGEEGKKWVGGESEEVGGNSFLMNRTKNFELF